MFVVGYGMDVAHSYRELPFIGRVVTAEDAGDAAVSETAAACLKVVFSRSRRWAIRRTGRARVGALRAELKRLGLAGFVVPRADEHQNEYVPANAERLRWLTGFAGSAGLAVVLKDTAALFVDGRYTEQVKTEADAVGVRVPPRRRRAADRMDRAHA